MTDMDEEVQQTQVAALKSIASALRDLGNGDSSDPRGAVEFLATKVGDVAGAILDLASAVRESTQRAPVKHHGERE